MNQLSINFARRTDPPSSHIAGASVRHFKAEHHQRILKALESGPMTAEQIAEKSGLDYWQVSRRMKTLIEEGKVRVHSETGGRSPKGKPCRIFARAECA